MTRYEDHAPRLAGEATQGSWAADRHRIYVVGPDGKAAGGMGVGMWPAVGQGYREDDAALIAYHHPGRVVALAAVVARLRERVAEGHAEHCPVRTDSRRFGRDLVGFTRRPCTCGHEDDVEALRRLDEEV